MSEQQDDEGDKVGEVLSLEDNNSSISAIVVEDLDDDGGDGLLDVVAASADRGFLYLFEGQTTGLSSGIPVNVQLPVEDLTALDADDDADIAMTNNKL